MLDRGTLLRWYLRVRQTNRELQVTCCRQSGRAQPLARSHANQSILSEDIGDCTGGDKIQIDQLPQLLQGMVLRTVLDTSTALLLRSSREQRAALLFFCST